MRAHAALGGLLEVELQHVAVGGAADRHAQAVRAGARPVPGAARRRAGQLAQPDAGAQPALAVASPSASRSGVSVRAIASRDAEVGSSRNTSGIDGASWPHTSHVAGAALGHGEPRVDVRGLVARARRSAGPATALSSPRAGQQLAERRAVVDRMVGAVAVDDHDQLGRDQLERARLRASASASRRSWSSARAQLALEQRLELRRRAGEQRGRPRRAPGSTLLVRQPLPPLPRVGVLGASKAVSSRRSCGARQAASWAISPRAHARERSRSPVTASTPISGQVDDDRLAAQLRAPLDQPARLVQRVLLVLGERVHPEVELDRRGRAATVPSPSAHVQEVAVVRAALPDVARA